jgi:hypothetical protein
MPIQSDIFASGLDGYLSAGLYHSPGSSTDGGTSARPGSNPIPSTASTASVVMVADDYDPFGYGGKPQE